MVGGGEPEAEDPHGVAGRRHGPAPWRSRRRVRRPRRAAARRMQHDAEHGGEEDELLAQGVEAAVVEVHRGDDIGDVALGHRQLVEDIAVGRRR